MAQLFVGQLPFNKFYPEDFLKLFRPFGTVISHELYVRNGSGLITFSNTDEADAAIYALHGKKVVEGRVQPLQVMYARGAKLISEYGLAHRAFCAAQKKPSNKNTKSQNVSTTPSKAERLSPEGSAFNLPQGGLRAPAALPTFPPQILPSASSMGYAPPHYLQAAPNVAPLMPVANNAPFMPQPPMAYSLVYVMGNPAPQQLIQLPMPPQQYLMPSYPLSTGEEPISLLAPLAT